MIRIERNRSGYHSAFLAPEDAQLCIQRGAQSQSQLLSGGPGNQFAVLVPLVSGIWPCPSFASESEIEVRS
jgi:hypothetical protein